MNPEQTVSVESDTQKRNSSFLHSRNSSIVSQPDARRTSELFSAKKRYSSIASIIPDLHGLIPRKGLQTELDSHDADVIRETITTAEQKTVARTPIPGAYQQVNSLIPAWYRVGWNSKHLDIYNPFNTAHENEDIIDELLPDHLYGSWYHNVITLFGTALAAYVLAKMNTGIGPVLFMCLILANYYRTSVKRFRRNTRDDIQRELSKYKLEVDVESVEWMNSFLQKFWLIFEPVLSALVVENLDNYITEYLPPYLDSIRLSTFTLGTKPFRIESIKTYLNTDPDTVCMDWKVSFTPNDLHDISRKELEYKVNPKVIMNVRFGKGRVGAGFPVLVEDMAFSGHLRVTIRFINKFPFAKLLEASFLERPQFDYVLKPMGTDAFGFDVNMIPGLQSFIKDQVHTFLGPLMYAPNVLSLDIEKFFSGDYDMVSANGVLAVTVYSISRIKRSDDLIDDTPNPYIRFYVDHGQELDRTSVAYNTYSANWNETRFLLLNNLNGLLSLELRTSRPGLKDRRLGTANFDLSALDREDQAEQEGLNLMVLRNGKHICDVTLDVKYMPVVKPVKYDDGSVQDAEESNSGVLRLTVHECRDLKSETTIHPYVRIIINGVEKKKTNVIKNNTDPKYEESCEIVVLDKSSLFARVEVRDEAADGRLMGSFTAHLIDILSETQNKWWDLINDGDDVGQVHLSFEWMPVVMSSLSNIIGGHGFDQPSIGVIRFTFLEARDLRNVELVTGGKSDPYVRILSGYQIRGRTEVIDNNLNPEWTEIIYVPVHSLKESFLLEVMDWNARIRDKTLGLTELKVSEIAQQQVSNESVNNDTWFIAKPKIDRWDHLRSVDKRTSKGDLHFSAEFFPTIALPTTKAYQSIEMMDNSDRKLSVNSQGIDQFKPLPFQSLNGTYIRYTPDDLVDLALYNSGVLKIRIHEVQVSVSSYCYCQVLADSLTPLYKTAKMRGRNLKFDEYTDVFIKEADLSRVAIEVKSGFSVDKDDYKLGYWLESGLSIIKRVMQRNRQGISFEEDEGTWFKLMATDGPGRIRLSFQYDPLDDFMLDPDESLDNQGELTTELISCSHLMAADKTGTSDPFVVFTINGEKVFQSDVIKKTLFPVYRNQIFTTAIQSRVIASIRAEVFDWNSGFQGDTPIGSGGITLRGDAVQAFVPRSFNIPLDGVEGVSGSVQVKFTWRPKLLANKKAQTTVLTNAHSHVKPKINAEVSEPLFREIPNRNYDAELLSPDITSFSRSLGVATKVASRDSNVSMDFDDSVSNTLSFIEDTNIISSSRGRAGVVHISILSARGLRGVDRSGTSDPYIRVKVGNEQIYRTNYIKKTLNPEWNETFSCAVGPQPFIFDLKVKDHNKVRSSVGLGGSRFNIWDLIKLDVPGGETFFQWMSLFPVGSGEILIKIQFEPSD